MATQGPHEFDHVRLRLASPEVIRGWSWGEVTRDATFQGSLERPVAGGLFCPEIFGPLLEWRCRCGRSHGEGLRHRPCKRCHTQVRQRRGRRDRMGHIELAAPVAHPWYVKARPSPLALVLGLRPSDLERIVYGEAFLVLQSRQKAVAPLSVLSRAERDELCAGPAPAVRAETGALALEEALRRARVEPLLRRLQLEAPRGEAAQERLALLQLLHRAGVSPAWMILRCLPVLPPALRPVVKLPSGRLASSELNELYRRVLGRNLRLRRLMADHAPRGVLIQERLLLQDAVDALFDNSRARRPITGAGRRPVRSLSDLLAGKQGRFRANLLGKRVDYSARSVIVVGAELALHQVGLPAAIALGLFEPLLLGELMRRREARTLRGGRQLLQELLWPGLLVRTARLAVAELARRREAAWWAARLEQPSDAAAARNALREIGSREQEARGRALLDELPSPEAVEAVSQCLQEHGRAAARRRALELLQARHERLWAIVRQVIAGHPVLLNRAPTLHRHSLQAFEPVLVEGNAIQLHPLVCKGFNADFDGDQMAVHLPLSEGAIAEALTQLAATRNLFNPANGQLMVPPTRDVLLGCYFLSCQLSAVSGQPDVRRAFATVEEISLAHELGKVATHEAIRFRLPAGTRIVEEGDESRAVPLAGGRLETTVGRVLFNALLPPGGPFYNLTMTGPRLTRVLTDCQRRLAPREMIAFIDRVKQAGFAAATRSGVSFAVDDVPPVADKPQALEQARIEVRRLRRAREDGNLGDAEYAELLREAWDRADKQVARALMRDLRADARPDRPALNPLYVMADSGARGSIDQMRQLGGMRGMMASVSGRLIERPITASLREGLPSWDFFLSAYGGRKGLSDKGLRTADAGYLTRKLVACAQHVLITVADCGTTRGVTKRAPAGALAGRVNGRVCLERVEGVLEPGELISPGQARHLAEIGREQLVVRSPITCQAPRGVCQRCYGLDLATRRLVARGTAIGVLAAQSIGEPGTQLTLRVFHLGVGAVGGKDIVNDLERVSRLLEATAPRAAADGEVDAHELLRRSGPEATADSLLEQVRRAYRQHGLEIDDRHFEVILSRMLGYVEITDPGASGLASGQVVDRRDLEPTAKARPILLGISQAALRGPGFLAAAAFQRAVRVLGEAALAGAIDALVGLKENVMLGRRIPADGQQGDG